MSTTIEIRSRWDATRVLYGTEIDDSVPSGLRMRAALERATQARANLAGAYLAGAYLAGAYLARANLADANLARADLARANLAGADLAGADLARADLAGADLAGANLARADLAGAYLAGAYLAGDKKLKLIGPRPVLTIGPIGSRADTLIAFITDAGIRVRAGCFFDTLDLFKAAVDETHGSNEHGREYAAAIVMIEAHASLFGVDVATAAEKVVTE